MLTATIGWTRYGKLRAEEKIVPLATPWQTVGAYAGEADRIDRISGAH